MIHQRIEYGDDGRMGVAEAENFEKYKSYIQRRRVGNPSEANNNPLIEKKETTDQTERIYGEDVGFFSEKSNSEEVGTRTGPSEGFAQSYGGFSSYDRGFEKSWASSGSYDRTRSTQALKRIDGGLYKKLYGNDHRSGSQNGISSYRSTHASGNTAEIADNRTTVLAIKIIKQALACFAILGIVVLMQQNGDLAEVLTFVKKHVVDTHMDPQNLFTGVENIIKECSRLLGGSP